MMDVKFVYSVIDGYNNTNIIGIYEDQAVAIECAKKAFREDTSTPPTDKLYQVNRIKLNCLSYPSEHFDGVWSTDVSGEN